MAQRTGVNLPKCNLILTGKGRDTNGNSIVKFKFPNSRGFSIQSNKDLPKTHDILKGLKTPKDMQKVSGSDLDKIAREACNYIKNAGSKKQKSQLITY